MRFFNENGCLKKGKQKLLFYMDICGDINVNILENKTPGNIYDLYAEYDEGFKMEKVLLLVLLLLLLLLILLLLKGFRSL